MRDEGKFLKEYRANKCLNCDTPLESIDRYCHYCGQANIAKRLSFKDFFSEFFASIFSYDSKLRQTILALLFNPGKISKEYIEGKRVKYSNPFRFYLSISILFFIINGLFIDFDGMSNQLIPNNKDKPQKAINNNPLNKEIKSPEKSIIDTYIATKNDNKSYTDKQLDSIGGFEELNNRINIYRIHYKKTYENSVEVALDSLHHKKNWYNKYLYKRSLKTHKLNDNPFELLEFVFNKLPFIIFFFLPIFAIVLWIFYLRKSFTYMEHLIFTFHTQTTFFILLGIAYAINQITKKEIALKIAVPIFLVYLYIAMLKFYQQKRGKTLLKFLLINLAFITLACIGSIIIVIGSILIF